MAPACPAICSTHRCTSFSTRSPVRARLPAAAIVVVMAAALVTKVGRASKGYWPEAGGVIGQAEAFRARVAPLAQAGAEAYAEALRALRGRETLEERYRDQQLRAALE